MYTNPAKLLEFLEKNSGKEIDADFEKTILEIIEESKSWNSTVLFEYIKYLAKLSPYQEFGFKTIDCCGTGGDGSDTFNISTCAAIIAAASGIKITKNGGRSSSSKTGSVDVLEALGVNLDTSCEQKISTLEKTNLAFFSSKISAELLSPIKQVCKKYKKTSFISLIAPFLSPIKIESQLIGIGKKEWTEPMTQLAQLLINNGFRTKLLLLHSELDGKIFDELHPNGFANLTFLNASRQYQISFEAEKITLQKIRAENLKAENPKESSQIIQKIIEPNHDTNDQKIIDARITSCLNSAMLLHLNTMQDLNMDETIEETQKHFKKSEELIKNGTVKENWGRFIKLSQ